MAQSQFPLQYQFQFPYLSRYQYQFQYPYQYQFRSQFLFPYQYLYQLQYQFQHQSQFLLLLDLYFVPKDMSEVNLVQLHLARSFICYAILVLVQEYFGIM